jgi:FkbH-like protein
MPYNDLRNFAFFVDKLNEYLVSLVDDYQNAFILDMNSIVKTFGSKYFQDEILWQYNHGAALGDNDHEQDQARLHPPEPISSTFELRGGDVIEALWEEVRAIYRTANGIGAVKLVIVDIDDTIWRGVAAEQDEPNPASLEGWPLGLAEALLYLKQRGIVLGIVSKNDEARIRDIWDKMWQNRLRLDDFAAVQINWNQKSENVAAILKAVNVLPDSVVFIDDNPVERFNVESAFPGIRTLGGSLYDIRRILLWAPETQSRQISDESARRHAMIKAQVERESARGQLDRGAFLASLEVKFEEISIRDSRHPRFDRAFELLNKTNQFNTTGQRWAMDEITKAFEQGLEIFAFSVTDRFTDYGLVGMALVRSGVIEQFVMSCRVIGLDVELECISRLKGRYSSLRARYHDTGKNFLCKDLFERAGLAPDGDDWVWSRMDEVVPQAVSTE